MSTAITDITGDRHFTLEADNPRNPDSVFLSGPAGFCVEFDYQTLLSVAKLELGLYEPLEDSLYRFLEKANLAA